VFGSRATFSVDVFFWLGACAALHRGALGVVLVGAQVLEAQVLDSWPEGVKMAPIAT
jgi:hypothetical protein